jgi:hypothetical protein
MAKRGELVVSREELKALGEYSCTIPTGVILGKRWRRDVQAYKWQAHPIPLRHTRIESEWIIGEYVDNDPDPKMMGILWYWAMDIAGNVWRGDL